MSCGSKGIPGVWKVRTGTELDKLKERLVNQTI